MLACMPQTTRPDRDLPPLLVVEDVARLLHLSRAHVRRLIGQGRIPGRRFGRRWFVPERKLLAMIEPSHGREDARGAGDAR
jgi:excisionase family DNA binding protein